MCKGARRRPRETNYSGAYVRVFFLEGEREDVTQGRGPDPMRALFSTLVTIGSILEAERKVWGRRVWLHDESDPEEDLGFPLSNSKDP